MFNISRRVSVILFSVICCLSLAMILYASYHKHLHFVDELWQTTLATAPETTAGDINEDFFEKWTPHERWYNLLNLNEKTRFDWSHIFSNVSYDSAPPLSFILLNTVSSLFFSGKYSKWPMIIVNIIFFLLSLIFLYKIMMFTTDNRLVSNLTVLIYATSTAGVFFVTYIRCYEIFISVAIMSIYAHLRFYPYLMNVPYPKKLPRVVLYSMIGVGVCYFLGYFNHFYFLGFAFCLSLTTLIVACICKHWSFCIKYSLAAVSPVILNFLVFRPSLFVIMGQQGDGRSASSFAHFLNTNAWDPVVQMGKSLAPDIYLKHWAITLALILLVVFISCFIKISLDSKYLKIGLKFPKIKSFTFTITPQNLTKMVVFVAGVSSFWLVSKFSCVYWMRYVCFIIPIFFIFIGWCSRSKTSFIILAISAIISVSYIKPTKLSWIQWWDPIEQFIVDSYNEGKIYDVIIYYPGKHWHPLINFTRDLLYVNRVYLTRDFDAKIQTDVNEVLVLFANTVFIDQPDVSEDILNRVQTSLGYSERRSIGVEFHGSMWLFSNNGKIELSEHSKPASLQN